MFEDSKWVFVERGSPKEICARDGHDQLKVWRPHWPRQEYTPTPDGVLDVRTISREIELIGCRRCGVEVAELHGKIRDLQQPM